MPVKCNKHPNAAILPSILLNHHSHPIGPLRFPVACTGRLTAHRSHA